MEGFSVQSLAAPALVTSTHHSHIYSRGKILGMILWQCCLRLPLPLTNAEGFSRKCESLFLEVVANGMP